MPAAGRCIRFASAFVGTLAAQNCSVPGQRHFSRYVPVLAQHSTPGQVSTVTRLSRQNHGMSRNKCSDLSLWRALQRTGLHHLHRYRIVWHFLVLSHQVIFLSLLEVKECYVARFRSLHTYILYTNNS